MIFITTTRATKTLFTSSNNDDEDLSARWSSLQLHSNNITINFYYVIIVISSHRISRRFSLLFLFSWQLFRYSLLLFFTTRIFHPIRHLLLAAEKWQKPWKKNVTKFSSCSRNLLATVSWSSCRSGFSTSLSQKKNRKCKQENCSIKVMIQIARIATLS